MRILHMCLGAFFIDNYSYQENLLPKYHKMEGHDVSVIASLVTFDENGKATYLEKGSVYENEYGIEVTRLNYKTNSKWAKRFRYFEGTYEAIEKYNPDVIFIHNIQFMDIKEVVRYLKKHPNVKVYADNHADFSNSATTFVSKNILHKIFWRYCAKKINPYVIKFYGVLPARVDFLRDVYKLPKEKIELLVMGADDEKVIEAESEESIREMREKLGADDDDFLIMTGGKIDKWKTQTLLLMDAVNNIKDKKVKLVVFGSVVPELKEEVNKRCSEKVKYIGWIQAKDSYKYFATCDIAVFPGRHSVFWEQVCGQGKPVIVKKWAGTTHVDLNGNCIFLENDSEEEIYNVLEEILKKDREKYKEMLECAQNAGKEMFLYSKIADRSIK